MQVSSGTLLLLVPTVVCLLAALVAARRLQHLPDTHHQQHQKQRQHQHQQHPSSSSSSSAAAADDDEDPLLAECVAFLRAHMPQRDAGLLNEQRLVQHARLALAARAAHPWAGAVPWQLWLNNVLPHRSLDEPLDGEDWRPQFVERFAPLVVGAASLTEAAQILNRDIWALCGGIHFVPDKSPEIMSVSQVLAAGYASCTGLSIFLVAACRAVGVPARVAGTPSWMQDRRDGDRFNNHNWVEVWDGHGWSFTGACEFTAAGLNRTWFFPEPAKRQRSGDVWHTIYAASYEPTATPFPMAWAPEDMSVPGVDVTQAYIDAPVLPAEAAGAAGSGAVAAGHDSGLLPGPGRDAAAVAAAPAAAVGHADGGSVPAMHAQGQAPSAAVATQ